MLSGVCEYIYIYIHMYVGLTNWVYRVAKFLLPQTTTKVLEIDTITIPTQFDHYPKNAPRQSKNTSQKPHQN